MSAHVSTHESSVPDVRPFISGVSIARRAIEFGYPLEESLRSLLPLVDELIVNVGNYDDGTWEAIQAIGDPKIRTFRSEWDMSLRDGLTLSVETNKALERCRGTWAVYLQADEVLHEQELGHLRSLMERHRDSGVESFSLRYLHFYGSYHTYKDDPRHWYPRATRIVRMGVGIESVGDAAAFAVRTGDGWRRPRRRDTALRVFHYGRVRPPDQMLLKQRHFEQLYHDASWQAEHGIPEEYDPALAYADRADLRVFRESHPAVMRTRVAAQDWPSPIPLRVGADWWRRPYLYASWFFTRLRARFRRVAAQ